jgi:hypothetical protein
MFFLYYHTFFLSIKDLLFHTTHQLSCWYLLQDLIKFLKIYRIILIVLLSVVFTVYIGEGVNHFSLNLRR